MKIILDKSGKGFNFTEDGIGILLNEAFKRMHKETEIGPTVSETFRKNVIDSIFDISFRSNSILIELAEKYGSKVIENDFIIVDVLLPEGIIDLDDRLTIESDRNGEKLVYTIFHSCEDIEDDYYYTHIIQN